LPFVALGEVGAGASNWDQCYAMKQSLASPWCGTRVLRERRAQKEHDPVMHAHLTRHNAGGSHGHHRNP